MGSFFLSFYYNGQRSKENKMVEEEGKRGKIKFSNSLSPCLASLGLGTEPLKQASQGQISTPLSPRWTLLRNTFFFWETQNLTGISYLEREVGSLWKFWFNKPTAGTLDENRREEKRSHCQSILQVIKAKTDSQQDDLNTPDTGLD